MKGKYVRVPGEGRIDTGLVPSPNRNGQDKFAILLSSHYVDHTKLQDDSTSHQGVFFASIAVRDSILATVPFTINHPPVPAACSFLLCQLLLFNPTQLLQAEALVLGPGHSYNLGNTPILSPRLLGWLVRRLTLLLVT